MLALNVTIKNARLTAIRDAIDAGTTAGMIKIYTAPAPNPPGSAITTQTLLAELAFADPCGTVTDGVLTFGAIAEEDMAPATGEAAWARITDSDGTWVADADIGITGSGAAIELNTINVYAGGIVRITAGQITEG
jgi:hypothetical protein